MPSKNNFSIIQIFKITLVQLFFYYQKIKITTKSEHKKQLKKEKITTKTKKKKNRKIQNKNRKMKHSKDN